MKDKLFLKNYLRTLLHLFITYVILIFVFDIAISQISLIPVLEEGQMVILKFFVFVLAILLTFKEIDKQSNTLYEKQVNRLLLNVIGVLLLMFILNIFPFNYL